MSVLFFVKNSTDTNYLQAQPPWVPHPRSRAASPLLPRPTALSCCPKMRLISLNIVCLVSNSSARPT